MRADVASPAACLTLFAIAVLTIQGISAHEISQPAPLDQPTSPVKIKSCYLGTNFMFDRTLRSEETKMQLGVALAAAIPIQYRRLGLRFLFTDTAGNRSADVIVFTGVNLSTGEDIMGPPPQMLFSGYLPRVAGYENVRCAMEFAKAETASDSWYANDGIITSYSLPIAADAISADALELTGKSSNFIFYTTPAQRFVFWSLDNLPARQSRADQFHRSVVALGSLSHHTHCLRYGPKASALSRSICFRPFMPR